MLFIAICKDKPDSLDLRLQTRALHLAWLQSHGDKLRIGGATLGSDLKSPTGSVLIYDGDSVEEIRELCAEDPYAKAGLFESVTVTPWRQAVGVPLA